MLNKYLKYKKKYLFLKEQMGGSQKVDVESEETVYKVIPDTSDKIYNFPNIYWVKITSKYNSGSFKRTEIIDNVYIYYDNTTSTYNILPAYTSNVSSCISMYYFKIDDEKYVLIAHLLNTLPQTIDIDIDIDIYNIYKTLYQSNSSIKELDTTNIVSISIYTRTQIYDSYLSDDNIQSISYYTSPNDTTTSRRAQDIFLNIKTNLAQLQTKRDILLFYLNTITASIKQDYVIPDSFKYLPCEIETEYEGRPNITDTLNQFIEHYLFNIFYFFDTITKKYKLKQYNTLEVHEYIFIEQKDKDYKELEDVITFDEWIMISNKDEYFPHEMECIIIIPDRSTIKYSQIENAEKFSLPENSFTVKLRPTKYCLKIKTVEKNKNPDYYYFNHQNYISIYEYKRASVYVRSLCKPILSIYDTNRVIAYVYLPLWNAQLMLLKKDKLTHDEDRLLLPFFKRHYETPFNKKILHSNYIPNYDGTILSNTTIKPQILEQNTNPRSLYIINPYIVKEVEKEVAVEEVEEKV